MEVILDSSLRWNDKGQFFSGIFLSLSIAGPEEITACPWFSFITHANNVQGTIRTVFTAKSAAVFAAILLTGLAFLRFRRKS